MNLIETQRNIPTSTVLNPDLTDQPHNREFQTVADIFLPTSISQLPWGHLFPKIPLTPWNKLPLDEALTFDLQTQEGMSKANARLEKEGKPHVNFLILTLQVEKIANDDSLSEKEKQKAIDALRKKSGLSPHEMKTLMTQRLAKCAAGKKQKLKEKIDELDKQLQTVQNIFGKNSPQAIAFAQKVESMKHPLETSLKKFESKERMYKGMYKTGSCIKKPFKKAFGSAGNFLKKITQGVLGTVKNLAGGILAPQNWTKASFWKNLIPRALSFIPGAGPVLSILSNIGLKRINLE